MSNIDPYMTQYEHEHSNLANRVLHAVGIPFIFAGIVLLFFDWRMGLALFVGGWIMLFLGHRIEGNKPAFFQGPIYFLVGPIWVAREMAGWLGGKRGEKAESKIRS
jgi:uncharacterized membrane protein YGL010W